MSYDKLQVEILSARDTREQLLSACLKTTCESLVFMSTAVPGANKAPDGINLLLQWGLSEANKRFGSVLLLSDLSHDSLGPYILFSTLCSLVETKRIAIEIEEEHPAARLLDLDVYTATGRRLGREDIGFPPRRCLLCDDAATNCIRTRRHDPETLNAHVALLLNTFSHTTIGGRPD